MFLKYPAGHMYSAIVNCSVQISPNLDDLRLYATIVTWSNLLCREGGGGGFRILYPKTAQCTTYLLISLFQYIHMQ